MTSNIDNSALLARNYTLEQIIAFEKTTYTKLRRAASILVGDVVSPLHAKGYPGRVVKVGPLTKTGRVTLYFEDSRSTCRSFERWHVWNEEQLLAVLEDTAERA